MRRAPRWRTLTDRGFAGGGGDLRATRRLNWPDAESRQLGGDAVMIAGTVTTRLRAVGCLGSRTARLVRRRSHKRSTYSSTWSGLVYV